MLKTTIEEPPSVATTRLIFKGLTDVYMSGPPLEEGPLPTLFYFALSGEQSLSLHPFNQPVAFLTSLPLRVFSFSLPYHDKNKDPQESMDLWAGDLTKGLDIVSPFVERSKNILSLLIEKELIMLGKVGVSGLSRGSFMAGHWAAHDSRISSLTTFAPLTRVDGNGSFLTLSNSPLAQSLALYLQADKLINCKIHCFIGNRDERAGTDDCFSFVRAVADAAYTKKIRSPQVEMTITPSIGHLGHGTPPHIFYAGAECIANHLIERNS